MPKLIVVAHYLPVDTQDAFAVHERIAEHNRDASAPYMNGNGHYMKTFRDTDSRPSSFYGDESELTVDAMDAAFVHLKTSGPDADVKPATTSHPPPILSRIQPRKAHSTLYSAIRHLEATEACVWVGIPSVGVPEEYQPMLRQHLAEYFRCHPVFIDQAHHQSHYDIYCKTILWPVLHYMVWDRSSTIQTHNEAFSKYYAVNELFAKKIIELYETGDDIWIHDYHLFMVPELVRRKLPMASIGFFLHVPFPSSELFRCLPQRGEILRGMLGANLIGFQTYAYARHFVSTCTRVLGVESTPNGVNYNGFTVSIGIFSIGVDVEKINQERNSAEVLAKVASLRELFQGKKVIIGRDKLDPIKGVGHKLSAFDKFLNDYPEWRSKVVLVQVTVPQLDSHQLENQICEMVSEINSRHGSLASAPVIYYNHVINRVEYFSLLTIADACLITSVRDGMNLTSHEYIVCQQEGKNPLILSEFTGTAGSLSAAIHINPWDHTEVARAINEALTISPEEKALKHDQMYSFVAKHTATFWSQRFVDDLRHSYSVLLVDRPPRAEFSSILSAYRHAKRRLLLFDYDGTLVPITKIPKAAVPSERTLKMLEMLVNDDKNACYVISGRDQSTLDEWLGFLEKLGLSGEHGSFLKMPEKKTWETLLEDMDLAWKRDVLQVFEYYTERTPGSFIEHKRSSLTWHYRLADPIYGSWQAKECQIHLENTIISKMPLEVLTGKKNIEVRPISINKGEVVKKLLNFYPEIDFIFCAGDDRTDEDMFRALRGPIVAEKTCFSCTIGQKTSQAQYYLKDPQDLLELVLLMANYSSKRCDEEAH